jgi:uncharacterized protein YuzE
MTLHYYEETDSLYIDLSEAASARSLEVEDGFVVDFDETGKIVGLDIQHASERVDLSAVETRHLPIMKKIA